MAKPLVDSYVLQTFNHESYTLTFEIPDNCQYSVSEDKGTYTITVKLKPGQTQPSGVFVTFQEIFPPIDDLLKIDFEQYLPEENTVLARPRIRVEP